MTHAGSSKLALIAEVLEEQKRVGRRAEVRWIASGALSGSMLIHWLPVFGRCGCNRLPTTLPISLRPRSCIPIELSTIPYNGAFHAAHSRMCLFPPYPEIPWSASVVQPAQKDGGLFFLLAALGFSSGTRMWRWGRGTW